MGFRHDRRGQAIQVGAVLLFAIFIIAFSSYQAVIIPADNRRVEFNHNQEVQAQLAELRNAVTGMAQASSPQSVTVALGTQYPSRTLGLNPPPPSGSLRTFGTDDPLVNFSIANATVDGEAGDFWNGSAIHYGTGGVRYEPNYNRYDEAPTTVYEHSLLYNRFDEDTLILANQTLVSGNTISVVTLDGSIARTSSSPTTVDVRPVSSSTETVLVEAESPTANVTLNFTSTLTADRWRTILSDEENVLSVTGGPSPAGSEYTAVRVELRPGVEYRLRMTKAAVGTGATDTDPAYLTDVAGDGASIRRGTSHEITLAVRDRYNNPVAGVSVNGSVNGSNAGSLADATKTTGVDGRVAFTYTTNSGTTEGDHWINFTTGNASLFSGNSFRADGTMNVSTQVTVTAANDGGGGDGAYSVNWTDPSGVSTNSGDDFENCDNETCVWDVGGSSDSSLALNATVSPVFEGVNVEFAVSNSSVGTVSPSSATTGSDGIATTSLNAEANGTLDVLASANSGSDAITIEVKNVTGGGGGGPTIETRIDDLTRQNVNQPVYLASYNLSNVNGSFERVEISVTPQHDATSPRSRSTTTGGVRFDLGYGAGDTYTVTYDVIYTASNGSEYVAASTTVTDTADARNPSGNVDVSTTGSAGLSSWTIEDRSQTNNNSPRYRYTYDVSQTGSFSEVRVHALNLPGSGASDVRTFASRSQKNQDIQLSNGANQRYRVGIIVRGGNGAVVDVVSVEDVADDSGTYSGP